MSGTPQGYLESVGRVRSLDQSIAAAGVFTLEFSEEYDAFAFQIHGGTAAARAVLLGFGKAQVGAQDRPAVATEVIDPTVFGGVQRLPRPTRWVTVFVVSGTSGGVLTVSGVEFDPLPRAPYANEILAALQSLSIAVAATIVQQALTWGEPAPVAMGAASATVIAANAGRKALTIQNTGTVNVALRPAAAAAVFADDVILRPGDVWQEPQPGRLTYTGEFRGITAGGAGELRVCEGT